MKTTLFFEECVCTTDSSRLKTPKCQIFFAAVFTFNARSLFSSETRLSIKRGNGIQQKHSAFGSLNSAEIGCECVTINKIHSPCRFVEILRGFKPSTCMY